MFLLGYQNFELHNGQILRVRESDYFSVDSLLADERLFAKQLIAANSLIPTREKCDAAYRAAESIVQRLWKEAKMNCPPETQPYDHKTPTISLTGAGIADILASELQKEEEGNIVMFDGAKKYFQSLFTVQGLHILEEARMQPTDWYLQSLKSARRRLEREFDSYEHLLEN